MKIPNHYELCEPTMEALRALDGRGWNKDIFEAVVQQMGLPEEVVQLSHASGPRTQLEHRLTRARTVLKTCGLIKNPKRGLWVLTEEGIHQPAMDTKEVRRMYLEQQPIGGSMVPSLATKSNEQDLSEDEFWSRLTTEQFFAGYSEADSIYDTI